MTDKPIDAAVEAAHVQRCQCGSYGDGWTDARCVELRHELREAIHVRVEQAVREDRVRHLRVREVLGQGLWALQLICCGRDDGEVRFEAWDQADDFRQSYLAVIGHDRAAILKKRPPR